MKRHISARCFGLVGLFALAALGASLTACDDTTDTTITQLNLDRPTDMAFACYGGLRLTGGGSADPTQDPGDITVSAQPIEGCDIRTGDTDANGNGPVPPGQEDLSASGGSAPAVVQYYGFILQPTLGVVNLASWGAKASTAFAGGDITLLDADPLTPGVNGIAVGEDPVAIVTDQVGCFVATANAGSCDLSELDIGTALDLGETPGVTVNRLNVTNASGQPVRAKPAAMVGQPAGGTIGVACPQTATGLAFVAYPGCNAVAEVDLSTGTVIGGVQYDATGVPSILPDGNLTCPDECDGGVATAGIRPVTLDLQRDPTSGRHLLAIGADNSPAVTLVELDPATDHILSLQQVAFQNTTGTLGVSQVAISPQVGMGGYNMLNMIDDTRFPFQFVYAVASDRTVRVAEVLKLYKECDAQVDPRYLNTNQNIPQLSCLVVGDPTTPPRRAGARGPGIELIGDDVPTSIAIFRVGPYAGDTASSLDPTNLIGYFGAIGAASGAVYLLNVDDDNYPDYVNQAAPLSSQIPLAIAHQLRDGLESRYLTAIGTDGNPVCDNAGPDPDATTGNTGGPRSPDVPAQSIPDGYIAADKVGLLPSIRQVRCVGDSGAAAVSELMFAAPVNVRTAEFPDLRGLGRDETWTLTWEGALSADLGTAPKVDGPVEREGQINVDAVSMRLDDQTRPFCDAGVQPWDIVQLKGCDPTNGNLDCPQGYVCYVHPENPITDLGSCELTDEADRLADACKDFFTSFRTYTVGKSTSGELVLLPRKHALFTTPIDGCTDSNQCQTLANYAAQNVSSANPIDPTLADTHTWSCELDPQRKPELDAIGNPMKRCLQTCPSGMDSDCTSGAVCQNGYCMDGVEPPQACVNAPQRYELHGGEAFVAIGSSTGYLSPLIADPTGACTVNPAASPLEIGRIPLRADACDPAANPLTGQRADGTYEPNPCQTVVTETDNVPDYVANTCTLTAAQSKLVDRQATAIQFRDRGMTLTMVDPTYPGDQTCIGDRMGGLGNVPIVAPQFQISFRVTAGFTPLELGTTGSSLPIKVLKQPITPHSTNTSWAFWIVDEGDFISTVDTTPSTRGRLFRINSDNLGIVNTVE